MSLKDEIISALTKAVKAKDRAAVRSLRLLAAAVKNREIEKRGELTDAEVTGVLKSEAKKRQEALEIYRRAGRQDLAAIEAEELDWLNRFLPAMLTEAEIKAKVLELKQAGRLPADFGGAMKQALAEFNGRADGRLVAEAVRSVL